MRIAASLPLRGLFSLACAVALAGLGAPPVRSQDCEHREKRVDGLADWQCMTPLSPTILYFVPGPKPGSDPPVPGPEALPCFDAVLYVQIVSNRLEHLANLTESGYECLKDMTDEDFARHQANDDFFKGVLVLVEDPDTGATIVGVVIHNDQTQYKSGNPFLPEEASYVMRQLRATFNESEIGELRYYPLGDAREAARAWLQDPEIAGRLDFKIHFPAGGSPREFTRGDTNDDGREGVADGVYLLRFLFGPAPSQVPDCGDALDVNDDGRLGTSDAVFLLYHLFIDSRRIPPPHDEKGFDRTPDDLPECGEPLG